MGVKKYFVLNKDGNSPWENNPTGEVTEKFWHKAAKNDHYTVTENNEDRAVLTSQFQIALSKIDNIKRISSLLTKTAKKFNISLGFNYEDSQKIGSYLNISVNVVIQFLNGTEGYYYIPVATKKNVSKQRKKEMLLKRDGDSICVYCRNAFKLSSLTIDHVFPLSKGGSDSFDNLVLACYRCNSEKKSEVWEF